MPSDYGIHREVCPSVLLYLFPERFLPYNLDGPPMPLSTSRIAVTSFWLALECLTGAFWFLQSRRLISLDPYTPTGALAGFRAFSRQAQRSLLPGSRHTRRVFVGPPARILVTWSPGVVGATDGVDGLEHELWTSAYAINRHGDLRIVLRNWFAGALRRLETFQVPHARGHLGHRYSIRDVDHRVLWAIENAAMKRGYLERLPVDAEPGHRWHGKYTFRGAFNRVLAVNEGAIAQLEESLLTFEAAWNVFRTENGQLYELLHDQCGKELKREGTAE